MRVDRIKTILLLLVCLVPVGVSANSAGQNLSPLVLTKIAENVYSAIGETGPPSYENGGHNNNLSFVVTNEGVVVFNGGDTYQLARRLHLAIREVTEQKIIWVADENGQGHSFLGNSYWRDQGAKLIAHKHAVEEMRIHGSQILQRMKKINRDKAEGTYVAVPKHEFEDLWTITPGGTRIELRSFGPAHSPGDISLWLPEEKILISGDIAFHQRLLAIFPDTNVEAWIRSFNVMASLKPEIIVPGHGEPTDIETVRWTTQGYLQFLTTKIEEILDDDGGLDDAYAIDQSAYAHLNTYRELAVKNAGRLFQTMEMEAF